MPIIRLGVAPKQVLDNQNLPHPILVGQTVMVFRLSAITGACFEGMALIKGPALRPHFYRLSFAGDPIARERFVHPDWQADPERALALLQQLWRAEASAIADFFPDNAS